MSNIKKDKQYYKFSFYGFLKNLRFFDAFFVLFLRDSGISFVQIGTLYAVREMFINIFEIPSGIFADAYGRKNSLIMSLVFYIISFLIFAVFSTFYALLPAFVLYGIADAFRSGSNKGMIMYYLRKTGCATTKSDYYGHIRAWAQGGSAVSSLIAGVFVFYTGNYRTVFWVSTIPYFVNLLLVSSYPDYLNNSHDGEKNSIQNFSSVISLFQKSLMDPKLFATLNTSALHTAYLKAIKDYIQLVMVTFAVYIPADLFSGGHKEGLVIALLYFFIYLLTSVVSAKSYALTKKIANKNMVAHITAIAGFVSGFMSGLFYILHFHIIAFLLFIVVFVLENIRKPFLTGLVAESVSVEIMASIMSVQSQLKTVLAILISIFFGISADALGPFASLSLVSVLLLVFYTIIIFIEKKREIPRKELISG